MSERSKVSGSIVDQVLVLVNPRAGRGTSLVHVDRLTELIQTSTRRVHLFGDLKEACEEANRVFRSGNLRALVSMGGDGTVAEIVNRTDPGLPICVYPGGTGNLLARFLGMRADPAFVANVIECGTQIRLDAGVANGRLFLTHAGCGFDAQVVRRVHHRRRSSGSGHISYWSYLNPILWAIRRYNYPEFEVSWETAPTLGEHVHSYKWRVRWLFALNLPAYGWGLPLSPNADGRDGLLDVVGFRKGGLWNGLRYLAATQFRKHEHLRDCLQARVARASVAADQRVPYQLDGDPGGWLPLELETIVGRLTFLVPEA